MCKLSESIEGTYYKPSFETNHRSLAERDIDVHQYDVPRQADDLR